MRIETLRDRHYRRYRHAAASRSAATRTASEQLTSKTADCPEPGAFAIVDEVYWLLVVAAQLGWPFPGLLLSKLRPSLDHEFDIETVRYLVRKEPKVHVLLLASAGLRVRLLDPKLANERMASIQASGSPISRDPKYGLWPVQSPEAEANWETERRALLDARDDNALSTKADRCYWLSLALAQAGWPMPASVTRRFSASWTTYAFSGDRLAALLGTRSEFNVADAILAGVRVKGLSEAAVMAAIARRHNLDAPDAVVVDKSGFERLVRSFSPEQIGHVDRVILRELADKMRGILTGRDQNAGQRLTLETFLNLRENGALLQVVRNLPSIPVGHSREAPDPAITARTEMLSSAGELPVEPREGAEDNGPSRPSIEEPTRSEAALAAPAPKPAGTRLRSRDEIERERTRAADEQSARRAGLIAAGEPTPDHDEIKRMLHQHEKKEREKQSALWAKLHAKGRPSFVLYDAASVDEGAGHDDNGDSDEAGDHEESTRPIASSAASGSDKGSDAGAVQEQATLDIGQLKSPPSTTPGDLSEPPFASPQAAEGGHESSATATQALIAIESPLRPDVVARLKNRAVILHRLGLPLPSELAGLVPDNVMNVGLSVRQIVIALPYPRAAILNEALVYFGHPPLRSAADCDGPLAALLERYAQAERHRIRRIVNGEEPKVIHRQHEVPKRWLRALRQLRLSRESAGYPRKGPNGPQPWDPLFAPHRTTVSEQGNIRVLQLDAMLQTYSAMKGDGDKLVVLDALAGRSSAFKEMASLARLTDSREQFLTRAMSAWKSACQQSAIDHLLPGFVD